MSDFGPLPLFLLSFQFPVLSQSQATQCPAQSLSIFHTLLQSLLGEVVGGSRPLRLTDRSWVATSPRGRPYQSPSLAELIGSLLFLAALLTFQSLECCASECLSVRFAYACIRRTSPVAERTKNHWCVCVKTFSKLKWPNCHLPPQGTIRDFSELLFYIKQSSLKQIPIQTLL